MSEKYVPQDGDRVRVVLEGPVVNPHVGSFAVGVSNNNRNVIYPGAEHVISIEKLARIWNVGDVVCGEDYATADIPIGTVAVGKRATVVKTSGAQWAEVIAGNGRADVFSARCFDQPRTIVYIPS